MVVRASSVIVKTDVSFAALHNMAQIRIYVCNMFLLDWIAVTNMRYNQIHVESFCMHKRNILEIFCFTKHS